jgi:hypothetical protein
MIPWQKGTPKTFKPGMILHYESGEVELVGSQAYYTVQGPIKAHYQAVEVYWLEWVEDMANKRGFLK